MPLPEQISDVSHNYGSDENDSLGAVASPNIGPGQDLSKVPTSRNRAIRDRAQAQNIVTTLETANRERNMKNARIMARYNSERPYSQKSLEAEGLGWKSNMTTKPLPMLIDKVAPRFVQAVEGVKFLTNSALPDDEPGAAEKTEAFRREITQTIRARRGWRNFVSEFGQENALFGYAAVAWLDEFSWFPKFFRQDNFFIPTGTKQTPDTAQLVVLKETFLLHELFSLIKDREAAETRGWNVKDVISAINNAMPDNRRSSQTDPERVYQDLLRESVVGTSYEAGARAVTVWHLLATEIDGQVSHYIFKDGCFTELFSAEDQYKSMAMATAFFSFQQGNGTMHGSKGIGREIYALAGILDRSRNEVVDRLNLAGKIIIQCDDKAARKFKMSLIGNAILIGTGYDIVERKFDTAIEPFLQLDAFLTALLDQISGATTPKVFEGERVTKAQVDLFASREEESRDIIMSRFLNQFADLMSTLQRRLCDSESSEDDAKDMQKRLLKVMSRKELTQLSEQVVAETVADFTDLERQQVVLVAQEAAGNPLFDQKELQRRKISAQVNEEFANAILLPDEDPTVVAEQTRLQQLELLIIAGQGGTVPISPRDNDLIHLQVLMPVMEQTAQQAAQDPNADDMLEALLVHAEQHLQAAEAKGVSKGELAEIKTLLGKLRKSLAELRAIGEQQAQTAEAGLALAGEEVVAAEQALAGGPPTV